MGCISAYYGKGVSGMRRGWMGNLSLLKASHPPLTLLFLVLLSAGCLSSTNLPPARSSLHLLLVLLFCCTSSANIPPLVLPSTCCISSPNHPPCGGPNHSPRAGAFLDILGPGGLIPIWGPSYGVRGEHNEPKQLRGLVGCC